MTALYRDLLSVISRKRVSENDSKRLKSFYDKAEQRRIAYAQSNVKITEAQISAMQNDIAGLGNESQAQISAARNDIESLKHESQARISSAQRNIADVKQESRANLKASQNNLDDIRRINREKNYVTYSWLGNMALSCVSFFAGDVFSIGGMIWDSANAYAEHQSLSEELEKEAAHQSRLIQQSRDNLNIQRVRLSRLSKEILNPGRIPAHAEHTEEFSPCCE